MIEEKATVQSVKDQLINIVTTQSSGCYQCNQADSCSTSILTNFFGNKSVELQLYSDMSLKAGDKVIIGMQEGVFIGLTCMIYILPLIGLFLFAVFGQFTERYFNVNNELPTISFAIIGFVACYYGVKAAIQRYFKPQQINPVILKKL